MGERVGIEEAARRLGVSQTSIRRRLRAGTLRGERRPTPQGHVWLVEIPDAPPNADPPAHSQPPAVDLAAVMRLEGELAVAREAVARLEAHNAALSVELSARRAEVERLIVLVAVDKRAALTDGEVPAAAEGDPPTGDQAAPTREAGGPPWWRRWWAAVATG